MSFVMARGWSNGEHRLLAPIAGAPGSASVPLEKEGPIRKQIQLFILKIIIAINLLLRSDFHSSSSKNVFFYLPEKRQL